MSQPLRLCILGSTGSIGQSTLRVVDEYPERFTVSALCCGSNLDLLREQIERYSPRYVAVFSEKAATSDEFKFLVDKHRGTEFFTGEAGVIEAARIESDICVSAIVGAAGLKPTLAAVPNTKRLALANKEALVMGGGLLLAEIEASDTELIPVDSEHSAIFSLLQGCATKDLKKIVLTASGGSLRDYPISKLGAVTPQQALAHPTWSMGRKITIDSATLVNKGLEVIEAHFLFGIGFDKIAVLLHPESIIHSMIQTVDGTYFAHLGVADMAYPISNSLLFPEILHNSFEELDFEKIGSLSFRPFDRGRYPALDLAYAAGRAGGTMTTVLNGANECAVMAFLEERIGFGNIVEIIDEVMSKHTLNSSPELDEIFEADAWARSAAEAIIRGKQ